MEALAAGNAALERADWALARARFEECVAAGDQPEAWEGLSRAAWWLGDEPATFEARERAYRAYRRDGNPCAAARMAMWIASDHFDFRGDDAVAAAWLRRGAELVADHPPCPELGYIRLLEADIALQANGDPLGAHRIATSALELARRIPDRGVEVVALAISGWALVASGAIEEGLQRIDESAGMCLGEEFDEPAAPGWALCHTVSACADVGDFGRAEQWCRALHAWSADWQARHFFGVCRTAYGDVLATGGDWPSAEQELVTALEDLKSTRPALTGPAAVRLGRLRARQGDVAEARALFAQALPLPQAIVALGELDLAAGDAAAAAEAADRVLRRLSDACILDRFPALELLARAHAAAGEHAGASAAADEAEADAERLATPYMRGRGRLVRARVLHAAGEHDAARRAAEDAADLFTTSAAVYEVAQSRSLLAQALEALGRHERAAAEAEAAREAFALLGARTDAPRASDAELSPRETDILRLVAGGLSDAEIAARLFLSPHTVHRHVANIRTKLRVSSRAAAVADAARRGLL